MRTSYSLLKSYTPISHSPSELAESLTQQGLEVESVIPYGDGLESFLIAEILEKTPHPEADKLFICKVSTGEESFEVVCGATNFNIQNRVVFAPPGATMPDGKIIQTASIRGIESHGMLCSGRELGLFDSQEGLWILPEDAPIGQSIRNWMPELQDWIFDIAPTPNRGDCLSTLGIAREVSILQNQSFETFTNSLPKVAPLVWDLKIESPDCQRYLGLVIQNVEVSESPLWLKIALKKYGLRSINNIVDISNLVMFERGTPVHIFDIDVLSLPVTIRNTSPNETITLLSGEEISIPENAVVISDAKKNIALAGIMGGMHSGVSSSTKNIFVELASFSADSIRQTAKALNISTDSSYRFIRNIDLEAIPESAAFLLEQLFRTTPGEFVAMKDLYPVPRPLRVIPTSLKDIQSMLGFPLSGNQVENLLSLLNFPHQSLKPEYYDVQVPSYRNDCSLDVDIIEELIRIYGYDKLPSQPPAHSFFLKKPPVLLDFVIRDLLTVEGLQEIYNFSFVQKEKNEHFSLLGDRSIPLENPLNSDFSHLRTSLLSSASTYLKESFEQGRTNLHIFELGQVFFQNTDGYLTENKHLFLLKSGMLNPRSFLGTKNTVNYFDLKDTLQSLFGYLGVVSGITYEPSSEYHFLHPHKSARVCYKGEPIGYIGEIHPEFWRHLKKKQPLIVAEIALSPHFNNISPVQEERTYQPFSRFPSIERDLSFILDKSITAAAVQDFIRTTSPLLKTVYLADHYEDAKFGENKKNLNFRMVFQSRDKTLTDQDIQPVIEQIIQWVKDHKNGTLREF